MKFTIKNQKGFTILEIFIALAIGLVLFAGVMSIFVGMRTTTTETSAYGELQENGRFAISLLSNDLLRQDFWGDYNGVLDRASLVSVPAAPAIDCVGGGLNNATFPVAVGHFRTLWGDRVESATPITCISDAEKGSDLLQLKRVITSPVSGATSASNYYLRTNTTIGAIFSGAIAGPDIDNSQTWQYQHHVYYVRETGGVPELMQGRLVNQKMSFEPIIDGIEVVRYEFGIDTDEDGIVNSFISTKDMENSHWNNALSSQILAIKIYVLARSIFPDNKYTNTSTYTLAGEDITVSDNYRRLLFTSTVTLFNTSIDSWN